jgi:ankyrin repeat protein
VKNLVEALPTTLDGTYTRMLERIRRLGPAVSEDALTLLRWLAYAARPITLAELQAAVTIRPEDGDVDFEDEGDFRDSLEILAGLVVSSDKAISDDTTSDHEVSGRETSDDEMSDDELWEDEVSDDEMSDDEMSDDEMSDDEMLDDAMSDYAKSNDSVLDEKGSDDLWPLGDEMLGAGAVTPNTYIRLAHFSVKEYLESIRISESSASFFRLEAGAGHKFLAQSCLTYLMSYSKSGDKTSPKLDMNKFRLLDYAAQYWYKHSKLQSGNDVGLEVALLTCDAARIDWIDAHGNWTYHQHFCNHSGDSSVYFAAMLRLKHVAEVLLIAGEDVNAVELGHIAPIIGATENDDQDMVKLLLAHGADINVNPPQKEHPLYLAARSGYSLLKLLIDNGADVNLPCFYGTALSIACVKGHRWVVEYLLERGAQVNNVDCDYWEVLAEVSRRCDKTLMDPLTTRDTNGKRPIRSSKPLLRAAALLDHAEIIPMLINAGVDINVEDNGALSDALMYGSENAVAMLESSGANKLTLEQLSRALVQVCCVEDNHKNQDRAVELLLGRGADVDAEDSSALSAALEYGHEHIVTLLETKGAKKLTLEHLNELLIRACENGYKGNPGTAVELLLDRGAEINAEDSSALFGALRHGYRGLVALLEAKGAEKLTQEQLTDALTRVPKNLGCCAYRKAVKMLVNRGADATAVDLSGI